MMWDDAPPKKKEGFTPRVFDTDSVEELESYIDVLRAEIMRTEAEIEKKKSHLNAAATLFKSPD